MEKKLSTFLSKRTKKVILVCICFSYLTFSLFAIGGTGVRQSKTLALGLGGSFGTDTSVEVDGEWKSGKFLLDFSLGVDKNIFLTSTMKSTSFSASIGAGYMPFSWVIKTGGSNATLSVGVLGGVSYSISPLLSLSMSLTPFLRINASYTQLFNKDDTRALEIRPFFDVGYKMRLMGTEKSGLTLQGGVSLSFSFPLTRDKVEYSNKNNSIYTGVYNAEEYYAEKQLDEIEKLKKERDYYKEMSETETIRYVPLSEEEITGTTGVRGSDTKLINESRENASVGLNSNANFQGARAHYNYNETSVYDVFLTPLNVTDIILEKGEGVVSIILGDPVSWIAEVKQTTDESADALITHVLFRPNNINIVTDCTILTDKRVYYLKLYSTKDTYLTSLSWRYPFSGDGVVYGKSTSNTSGASLDTLDSTDAISKKVSDLVFLYKTEGKGNYKPDVVFSDGERTYLQFGDDFLTNSVTPLVYLQDRDGSVGLCNFSIKGTTYTIPLILQNGQYFVLTDGDSSLGNKKKCTYISRSI